MLNPMFRLIGRLGERELFVVAGLFTVVGASARVSDGATAGDAADSTIAISSAVRP